MAGKQTKSGNAAAAWIIGIVVVGCVAGSYALGGGFGDDSTTVPGPTRTETADTVAILGKAADKQGICYGWRLEDDAWRGDVVSEGSNLGAGMAVDSDPSRCPRWVQVIARVNYTSASSEAEDSASIEVESTEEDTNLFQVEHGLNRLGLNDEAFIDEPGWAVTRAAVSLPLLMAEQGEVPAAPVSTDAPAAAPSRLPDPGPDLWRDRWGYLLAGAAMLLVTVVLVLIGRAQARRERAAAEVPVEKTSTSGVRVTDKRKTAGRR